MNTNSSVSVHNGYSYSINVTVSVSGAQVDSFQVTPLTSVTKTYNGPLMSALYISNVGGVSNGRIVTLSFPSSIYNVNLSPTSGVNISTTSNPGCPSPVGSSIFPNAMTTNLANRNALGNTSGQWINNQPNVSTTNPQPSSANTGNQSYYLCSTFPGASGGYSTTCSPINKIG